jgi:hypothetical protein
MTSAGAKTLRRFGGLSRKVGLSQGLGTSAVFHRPVNLRRRVVKLVQMFSSGVSAVALERGMA